MSTIRFPISQSDKLSSIGAKIGSISVDKGSNGSITVVCPVGFIFEFMSKEITNMIITVSGMDVPKNIFVYKNGEKIGTTSTLQTNTSNKNGKSFEFVAPRMTGIKCKFNSYFYNIKFTYNYYDTTNAQQQEQPEQDVYDFYAPFTYNINSSKEKYDYKNYFNYGIVVNTSIPNSSFLNFKYYSKSFKNTSGYLYYNINSVVEAPKTIIDTNNGSVYTSIPDKTIQSNYSAGPSISLYTTPSDAISYIASRQTMSGNVRPTEIMPGNVRPTEIMSFKTTPGISLPYTTLGQTTSTQRIPMQTMRRQTTPGFTSYDPRTL